MEVQDTVCFILPSNVDVASDAMFLHQFFFLYLFPFAAGNLSSLVVPAATLGAVGYGYMWWKVWNCLDYCCFCKLLLNSSAITWQNLNKSLSLLFHDML
jgi:hypothetical protein